MKTIVTGGTGHIGTFLIPMLVEAGHEVINITRGQSRPYEADPAFDEIRTVVMDRETEEDFAGKIAGMKPDVVIDLINFTLQDTEAMVAALRDTDLRHYVFCSSIWTHGRSEILPLDTDTVDKDPLDAYGEEKYASELYLKSVWLEYGFPATIIMPGQISGPGWNIINPWGNISLRPFEIIARGEEIKLPNFGMETLHHVHAYDVAQCFFKAVTHRDEALGESFDAVSGGSVTLYGYARMMYEYFGHEPKISFLPWDEWCDYEGDPDECEATYLHIARSGFFSTSKGEELIDYRPRYSNVETIWLAVQSLVDRGLVTVD